MVNRINLILDEYEFSAIYEIAKAELRNPADQIRYMLRSALEKDGLLPEEPAQQLDTTVKGVNNADHN